jgi:hypothetical protein
MFQLNTIVTMLALLITMGTAQSACDISSAKPGLPEDQTIIDDPNGEPLYIALGVGSQNYTCTDDGTYL